MAIGSDYMTLFSQPDEIDDIAYSMEKEIQERYFKVMDSDLSVLQMYISLYKNNTIKPRINNIFYCDCPYHNADDLPVRINEDSKICICHGCGTDFSIIKLVKDGLNISYKDALDILYAYSAGDLDILNKKQLEEYKKLFKMYNLEENKSLRDKYLNESKEKKEYLENRIKNYIEKHDSNDIDRISKRLCCHRKYIKKYIKSFE